VTTMTHTELQDGNRTVRFDGQLLGSTTSEYTQSGFHKARWTVFEIYRTTEGGYVISKIGKSRIVHSSQRCVSLKNNTDPLQKVQLTDQDFDDEIYEFCDPQLPEWQQCWTDDSLDRATYGYLENDHAAATFADSPVGAVSLCYSRDRLGAFDISWIAKATLKEAGQVDEDLKYAYENFDLTQLSRKTRWSTSP
jgi:hypothetical protein